MRVSLALLVPFVIGACANEPAKASAPASGASIAVAAPPNRLAATDALIREAIANGPTTPNSLESQGGAFVLVSTPYWRIATAAQEAKKRYEDFTADSITPVMKAPEVHLWTGAFGTAKTVAVVIAPRGATDSGQIIRPTRTAPMPDPDAPTAIMGTFPLDALSDAREVRIVYEPDAEQIGIARKVCPKAGPVSGTVECVIPIDMRRIR